MLNSMCSHFKPDSKENRLQQSSYALLLDLFMYFSCWSVSKFCPTLCDPMTAAHQASLSFTISRSLLKLMSIESVMPSNHLILCCPLLLSSVFPSIRLFSNESVLHIRYQSIGASASVLPMNIQGWFPLGLTGLILSSKGLSSVFSSTWSPAQFESISSWVLSLLYDPTLTSIADYGKAIVLTFVSKVMSLLFHTLSRFIISFLPKSKSLLILCLQSPSAVILESKKIKSVTV